MVGNLSSDATERWRVFVLVVSDSIICMVVAYGFWLLDEQSFSNNFKISINYLQVISVAVLAFFDVALRHFFFQRFQTVRAISIDILVFAIVSRIGHFLTDVVNVHNQGPNILILLLIIALLFAGLYVYREMFLEPYMKLLHEKLRQAIGDKLTFEDGEKLVELCIAHKHPDLWGINRAKELQNVNDLLTRCIPTAPSLKDEDVKLDLIQRLIIVAVLGFISSVALFLSGMTINIIK